MNKITILLIAFSLSAYQSTAQNTDSLMRNLSATGEGDYATASFKSSRLILSQTTTMVKKYDLDFKVIHRFGDIGGSDGGSKTLYGLDNSADIYIGFEYGISDRLNIAFGRSKFEQLLDLQMKYAVLQQKDKNGTPISFSALLKTGFTPYKVNTGVFDSYGNRFSHFIQAIISRKFSPELSLQVTPGVLFRNVVLATGDEMTLFSTGIAGRYKLTKRFGVVADYYLISSDYRKNNPNTNFYNPLGLGIEIETGGHVFTMNFANAKAIAENNFLANSTSSWTKGQYRFGFTISRMFTLYKPEP
ncbi:DUF5777 family beta-barrel protein [Daejeonella lutea]|uniref:DUF5777 domain-containing protein n=1 Tax=Daejeonella lutea TaxID=572036 RepID=A0A1T5ARV1_9SPHI|nr:DUF5777 family beta-barrel protein [Daejeonella lutea]SKB37635.1 hypothetical protein SAMN05661099_0975 [Daejeonella lutea]